MSEADDLLRDALLAKAKLAKARLASENQSEAKKAEAKAVTADPMVPRADDGTVTVQPKKASVPLRQQMSQEGRELAEQAATGFNMSGEGGIVDVPDEVLLYGYSDAQKAKDPSLKDGPMISIPQAVQLALELIGDSALTVAGTASEGAGYVIGGIADLLMKAGMSEGNATRFARDMMAMPDAFMGSPSSLMRGRKMVNPSVGGITEAQVARQFTPDEITAMRTAQAPVPAAAAPTAPVAAQAAAQAAPTLTPDALGELIRVASTGGRGSQKAAEALAAAAKVNPDAAAAAERLGIDVPADILSNDTQLKSAAGLSRSIAGSEAEADFRNVVVAASRRANEVMAEMDATPDISTVAARIKTTVLQTRAELERAAKRLYKEVDAAVPASSLVEPQNSVMLLNKMLEDLGGVGGLTGKEKILFDKLTDPNTPLTYAALKKFRTSIGRAVNQGEGEYADMDIGTAKRIYGALTEDYLATAQKVGGDEARATLRLANQTTAKQKALEKRMINFFAKDGEKSIASVLTAAMSQGSKKGDITNLNRILKLVPQEMQREALATALGAISRSDNQAFDGPFDFAKFSSTFNALKINDDVYKRVIKILGPETEKVFNDLNDISKLITQGRAAVIPTGKANQAVVQAITAEGAVKTVFQRIMGNRIVRAGVGYAGGGQAGAMAMDTLGEILLSKKDKIKIAAAGGFFNSSTFKKLAVSASEPEIAAAIKTPAFKRLANALNISDGRGFLEAALLASSTNESSVGPAEAATPEAQAMYDSVKVPTMQFDEGGATAALIRSLKGTDAAAQLQEAAQ